jgi:hypothetical protein
VCSVYSPSLPSVVCTANAVNVVYSIVVRLSIDHCSSVSLPFALSIRAVFVVSRFTIRLGIHAAVRKMQDLSLSLFLSL